MASERLETAEKIVRMTNWGNAEAWEYSENEQKVKDPLAAAKRFVSAQAFLLSWQEGKVPTGWRRPRKLMDFEGKYPQQVIDQVNEMIKKRASERNLEKTAQLNAAVLYSRGSKEIDSIITPKNKINNNNIITTPTIDSENYDYYNNMMKKNLSKIELDNIKKELSQFTHQLNEAKTCLKNASNIAADVTFKINALSSSN